MEKHLSKSQLLVELSNRKGLIPVDMDLENGCIRWMDFEGYHFYEGFFHKSLRMFTTLKDIKGGCFTFTTNLDVFNDDRILIDNIYPTGFIFHAGRSGSTLLAKIFASLRKNLVLSEASIHNNFWLMTTANGTKTIEFSEKNKKFYKNLLLATARRRLASHKYCFIKFTSFNIHFYRFIRSVFPEVPAIFLYRQPSEILLSIKKKPLDWIEINNEPIRQLLTSVSENEFLTLKTDNYKAKVLENLFTAAIENRGNQLKCLDFNNLKSERFTEILNLFQTDFTSQEIDKMKSQFNYYSKTENKLINFSEFVSAKKVQSSESILSYSNSELEQLYKDLQN